MRAVAVMSFTSLRSPSGPFVMFILCSVRALSGLQSITIDSLFTKRLPADVRASMIAVKSICATLGKLLFVVFSQFTETYFDHIFQSMEIIGLFDAAVFVMLLVGILMYGFEYDQIYIG